MGYLVPPKRALKNHPVRSFDIETYGDKRQFICGTVCDKDGCRFSWDRDELQAWVTEDKAAGSITYATNLHYDYTSLFGGYPAPAKALFAGSRLIRVHYPIEGRQQIKFYDTSNLTNHSSVASLGEQVGLKKLEIPEVLISSDGKKRLSRSELDPWREEIKVYNKRDALITWKWARRFQDVCSELGCEVKTTIASTGMDLFRRQYLGKGMLTPAKWENEYIREAYHGGFTFVFKRGLGKEVTYYDIHSLYPYVLATRVYPDWSSVIYEKDDPSVENIFKYEGFSRVRIHYPDTYFPILPVTINGYLLTATGDYEGLWTHVELRAAVERGAEILEVYENIYTTETFTPLKRYMVTLYERRLEAKRRGDRFEGVYKLFMNALSGKWGQRYENTLYEPVDVDSISDPDGLKGIVTEHAGDVEYFLKSIESHYTPQFVYVPLAVYMTAYARLHEIKYLEEAFPDVYACDTDSVFTHHSYELGNNLGEMGIKAEPRDWVYLYPKQYASHDREGNWTGRIKGVPRDLQEEFLTEGKVTWQKPSTFKEAVERGITPGDWIERERSDRDKYDKRVYLEEINPFTEVTDSRPFTYEEAEWYFSRKLPALPYQRRGALYNYPEKRVPATKPWTGFEREMRRQQTEDYIKALRGSLTLPISIIRKVWNWGRNEPRGNVNGKSAIRHWEDKGLDSRATELGYNSVDSLLEAIRAQVATYKKIRELERRL